MMKSPSCALKHVERARWTKHRTCQKYPFAVKNKQNKLINQV